jgi:diguanylate cyclase
MRYNDNKAHSAELLRMALAQMAQHPASFNPVTFTVWYEHVAGMNQALSDALLKLLAGQRELDNDAMRGLYETHVLPPDSTQVAHISAEMHKVMKGIAESASQTGMQAGDFGDQLTSLTVALQQQSHDQLAAHVVRALEGTNDMKNSVQALQNKVAASQDEIKRLREDLDRTRSQAMLDPLTGLLNRQGFDQSLQSLMSRPVEDGDSHCLMMLDIDHFKHVNDTHGHLAGDRVIRGLGEILRTSVQKPDQIAARYGGEEFALVLPKTSTTEAAQMAETIRQRTKAMKLRKRDTQEVLLTITISSGLTRLQPGDDALSLIARADAALYQSKNTGRDKVTLA